MEENIRKRIERKNGITLIALVITIIVLLILAGVSLSMVLNQDGIFSRAENSATKYNEAKAREVLETVLLTDGQMEKRGNSLYNQDEFLDDLIKSEIPGAEIKGDIVILGDYGFELDRSVPKIGKTIYNIKDLIWPVVNVDDPIQANEADDYRTATISITATIDEKAENGINKIEIWQNGVILETFPCNKEKSVTKTYTANKNGVYTIRAYADIVGSKKTTVEGIVPAIEFSPNGSTDWKKTHTTTVKVNETAGTVTEMKYLWKKSTEGEPQKSDFDSASSCTNNSQITGQGDTMTGQYCLWVLTTLGTESNQRTYISGSEEFYFDNEGPTVELETIPASETSFILTATASDTKSGIAKYEFYIDNVKVDIQETTEGTATYTWNGIEMEENKECYLVVTDKANNDDTVSINATTKLHHWKMYPVITRRGYSWEKPDSSSINSVYGSLNYWDHMPNMDPNTGELEPYTGSKKVSSLSMYKDYVLYNGNCIRENRCQMA